MDIDTFLAKKAELQKALQDHAKEMMHSLFSHFFEHAPEVKTITWSQHTPHFNDGDPCVFRVREVHFASKFPEEIKGFSRYGSDDSEDTCWINTYANRSTNPVVKDFHAKFRQAEMILETLGDPAHVTVTNRPDGIKIDIEEYEHD